MQHGIMQVKNYLSMLFLHAALGLGIVHSEPTYVRAAGVLFVVVLILSGAAGGLVHYATRGLRERGPAGYYASAILTVQAYVLTALAILAIAVFSIGEEPPDSEIVECCRVWRAGLFC